MVGIDFAHVKLVCTASDKKSSRDSSVEKVHAIFGHIVLRRSTVSSKYLLRYLLKQ